MGGMMRRLRSAVGRWGGLALSAALLSGGLASAAAPTLRWKFAAGEALHYQMDQKAVTELKANGQSSKTSVTQTLDTTWNVQKVDAAGVAEMVMSIDRMQTKIESPFGAVEYDSKSPKPLEGPIAAGVVPVYKALVGAKFKYKISPNGELSDIVVPEGLMKSLREAGPTANSGMFSEDGLKNMIRESGLLIPDSLDKPWTKQKKIPAPPVGTQIEDSTYKYEGKENDDDKIGVEVKVALEPAADSKFDAKINAQEGKGSFYFDAKVNRVVRSHVVRKLEMAIKVMGAEVVQSQDTTTDIKLVKVDAAPPK